MKKIYLSMVVIPLLLGNSLMAKPNVPIGEHKAMAQKAAGEIGPFAQKEKFPKDYFLINKNLPFLASLSLHHPKSDILELSKEQIQKILDIKKRTVPTVLKAAKEIKSLELELSQKTGIEEFEPKDFYTKVEEIGTLKAELTKAHLVCIKEVRDILSKEQYKKLLSYSANVKKSKEQNNFKIDELVILPHPGQIVKLHNDKLQVTKEQKKLIESEIKAVYPNIFQSKIREAFKLEQKLKRMVAKGKTKEDTKELLNNIAKLKREAMDSRIDALNHFKKIVTKEQWGKIIKISNGGAVK